MVMDRAVADNWGGQDPGGTAYPSVASDSATAFIPEIWSLKVLRNFYNQSTFAAVTNTDYEGEIKKFGDVVNIRTTPEITIKRYVVGGKVEYEVPTSDKKQLHINQSLYYAYRIDNIDEFQSDINMQNLYADDGGEQLNDTMDKFMLSFMGTSIDERTGTETVADIEAALDAIGTGGNGHIHSLNRGAAAGMETGGFNLGTSAAEIALTSANIVNYIVDVNNVLDEAKQRDKGRFFIIPHWAGGLIKKSDLKAANITGDDTGTIRNGLIGKVDRSDIYTTNNIKEIGTTGVFPMVAGTTEGCSFAAQMTDSEILPIQDSFGKYFRSMVVYGREQVQPKSIALLLGTKG